MKPLTQGKLDGLCGVYSILNALRILEGTTLEESANLFLEIFAALETRKKISRVIGDGMTDRDMGYVYREIIQKHYPVRVFKPFHRKAEVPLGAYRQEVKNFLDGGNRRAVNLVVESWDFGHWTVVRKATPKCLYLWDSARMRRFDRRKCTTQVLSTNRDLLLWPTMTRFLSRKE